MGESAAFEKKLMAQATEIKGTIAILGAAAAGVVAVLVGALYWAWPGTPGASGPASAPQAVVQQPASQQAPAAEPSPAKAPDSKASEAKAAAKPAEAPVAPSFDLVRVEPNGESVIAGRAAAGATIELMRGDQVHARAVADASGLFAIVPPALPPGSHHIALQSIAPDGVRQRSAQSVTVVIDAAQKKPLVTLTTPDQPTVVLSNPEPPEPQVAQNAPKAPEPTAKPEEPAQPASQAPQQQANAAAPEPAAQPAPRPEVKIVSVEAEKGKLFVSGLTAPGATVRLYLNDTLIAPGGAGADGKVSFSIGSGVQPGDYRIRLDDVDPVSGKVKSRAEVGFSVPVQVASAQSESPIAPSQAAPSSAPPAQAQAVQTATADAQVAAAGTIVIPNINTAIVSRGDNLWRISQRIYGKGYRYTVIYGANQDQIRNPDLIYPGQVFVLPNSEEQKTN